VKRKIPETTSRMWKGLATEAEPRHDKRLNVTVDLVSYLSSIDSYELLTPPLRGQEGAETDSRRVSLTVDKISGNTILLSSSCKDDVKTRKVRSCNLRESLQSRPQPCSDRGAGRGHTVLCVLAVELTGSTNMVFSWSPVIQ